MSKKVILIFILILFGTGLVWFFNRSDNIVVQNQDKEDVVIFEPMPNDVLTNPVKIRGKARGNWYFEASFPVKLLDGNGNVLAQEPIQAQGEWMTTDYVPFEKLLSFTQPTTDIGILIFQKDNPSGLPENDKSFSIPVKFAFDYTKVNLFFISSDSQDCVADFKVERSVIKTSAIARATLDELLKGPSQEEKNAGVISTLSGGVVINNLVISNGVAKVDFNNALQEGIGGSCWVTAIRSQIENTLKQFSSINDIKISINGQTEGILQP